MNAALTALALLTGQTPNDELELARAAVAVEVAKLALSEPAPTVVPAVVTPPTARVWVSEFWPGYGWVQVERESRPAATPVDCPEGQP